MHETTPIQCPLTPVTRVRIPLGSPKKFRHLRSFRKCLFCYGNLANPPYSSGARFSVDFFALSASLRLAVERGMDWVYRCLVALYRARTILFFCLPTSRRSCPLFLPQHVPARKPKRSMLWEPCKIRVVPFCLFTTFTALLESHSAPFSMAYKMKTETL